MTAYVKKGDSTAARVGRFALVFIPALAYIALFPVSMSLDAALSSSVMRGRTKALNMVTGHVTSDRLTQQLIEAAMKYEFESNEEAYAEAVNEWVEKHIEMAKNASGSGDATSMVAYLGAIEAKLTTLKVALFKHVGVSEEYEATKLNKKGIARASTHDKASSVYHKLERDIRHMCGAQLFAAAEAEAAYTLADEAFSYGPYIAARAFAMLVIGDNHTDIVSIAEGVAMTFGHNNTKIILGDLKKAGNTEDAVELGRSIIMGAILERIPREEEIREAAEAQLRGLLTVDNIAADIVDAHSLVRLVEERGERHARACDLSSQLSKLDDQIAALRTDYDLTEGATGTLSGELAVAEERRSEALVTCVDAMNEAIQCVIHLEAFDKAVAGRVGQGIITADDITHVRGLINDVVLAEAQNGLREALRRGEENIRQRRGLQAEVKDADSRLDTAIEEGSSDIKERQSYLLQKQKEHLELEEARSSIIEEIATYQQFVKQAEDAISALDEAIPTDPSFEQLDRAVEDAQSRVDALSQLQALQSERDGVQQAYDAAKQEFEEVENAINGAYTEDAYGAAVARIAGSSDYQAFAERVRRRLGFKLEVTDLELAFDADAVGTAIGEVLRARFAATMDDEASTVTAPSSLDDASALVDAEDDQTTVFLPGNVYTSYADLADNIVGDDAGADAPGGTPAPSDDGGESDEDMGFGTFD
jgi:tetratricopeptide (TPR) repeat protein